MTQELTERFVQDLAFIITVLTHVSLIFCIVYVLANLRMIVDWIGLTKGDAKTRSPSSWLEWLGLRKKNIKK